MGKKISLSITSFFLAIFLLAPVSYANEDLGKKIAAVGKDQLGVPYKWGGTTPSGFDCSGFILYVFNQFDISLPRTSAQQATVGKAVSKSKLQAGDLVFFKTSSASISHAGIYIGNNQFISATTSKGIKIDSLNDPYYWGSRYVTARRVIEEKAEEPVVPSRVLSDGEYYDVAKNNWAYPAITSLSKQGIINGYAGSLFKPGNTIKRSEVAKMLSETFNLKASKAAPYSDVAKSHWAYGHIAAATEHNFFTGYDGNKFKPDEPITRAEIAALFARVFELKSQNGQATQYNDLPKSHWAYADIQKLTQNEIATGYSDQTFKASKQTSRAEFSQFLYNTLQK